MLPKEDSRGSVRGGEAAGPRTIRISAGAHPGAVARRRGWPGRRGGLQGRVRARLALRLPDAPPLRRRQPSLVGVPEPGEGARADEGEAEPEHRQTAESGAGVVAKEKN